MCRKNDDIITEYLSQGIDHTKAEIQLKKSVIYDEKSLTLSMGCNIEYLKSKVNLEIDSPFCCCILLWMIVYLWYFITYCCLRRICQKYRSAWMCPVAPASHPRATRMHWRSWRCARLWSKTRMTIEGIDRKITKKTYKNGNSLLPNPLWYGSILSVRSLAV